MYIYNSDSESAEIVTAAYLKKKKEWNHVNVHK